MNKPGEIHGKEPLKPAVNPPAWDREKLADIVNKTMPCNCIDDYKKRNLSAPDCPNCNYAEDIIEKVLKYFPPVKTASNHDEMCGIKEGKCYVCGEQTNSMGANPSLWGFFFPHIDGQTKHRIYHMKCLYPLLNTPVKTEQEEGETDNDIAFQAGFKAGRESLKSFPQVGTHPSHDLSVEQLRVLAIEYKQGLLNCNVGKERADILYNGICDFINTKLT
jgi:hypothetical protein